MQSVQFFIVHGALIWEIALPLLTWAAGAFLRWLWRRWRARSVLRSIARVSLQVRALEAAQRTYVRGTLRGGTLMTCAGPGAVSTSIGDPWLDCSGERVDFDAGHIRVVHGTRLTSQWWHPIWPRTDRSVLDGDDLIVGGELVKDERGWNLRPVSDHVIRVSHDVYAARPDVRPGAAGLLFAITVLGSIAAGFYGVMHHVGAKARAHLWSESRRATQTIDDLTNFEIAASMPDSADDLPELLDGVLQRNFPHTEATFQLRGAVLESRGVCPFWLYFNAYRFDEAVAVAERCGTRDDKLWGYVFDGRFDEAQRQLSPEDVAFGGLVAIALGHWNDAARVSDAFADQNHEDATGYHRCVAALFRAYGGDARAFDRFPTLSGQCALFKAISLAPEQQGAALDRVIADGGLDENDLHLAQLVTATMPQRSRYSTCCFDSFGMWSRDLWFVPFIEKAHRDEKEDLLRDKTENQLAELDLERGDPDAAKRALALIANPVTQTDTEYDLELAIGLPLTTLKSEFLRSLRRIRNAGNIEHVDAFAGTDPAECVGELRAAAAFAAAGDGGWLARVMSECTVDSFDQESWVALLPRVKVHRDELAAALRLRSDRYREANSDEVPFRLVGQLAMRRTISHLIGDDDQAQREQAIIDRHATVLTDLHKLIAFRVWTRHDRLF